MSESQHVAFAVSAGSYSDYHVIAVFTTREAAEAYLAKYNATAPKRYHDGAWTVEPSEDTARLEELPLNPTEPEQRKSGAWGVYVDAMGKYERALYYYGHDPHAPARIHESPHGGTRFFGYGQTPEHARRSAEELRRAVLAGTVVRG